MKLIIISNRLPLTIINEDDEYKITHSAGGLSTGLNSLETTMDRHWVGWPGMYVDDAGEKDKINKTLTKSNFHPIYLSENQIEKYYEGYSNRIIWPLFHYFFNTALQENDYWNAYKEVNALFCKKVLEIAEPDDIIWVQDYQLMLLPQMIRDQMPEVSIGYFHHIPFPSYELFRYLPERSEILKGLLGADLIAFHTHGYMRHFISAAYRVLKIDCHLDEIFIDGRVVHVDAFPMGINYEMFHNAPLDSKIKEISVRLRKDLGEGKLILSVDRLDYSKGILMRLMSFESFLTNHPEYLHKVSLVMIVAPSRDGVEEYALLKEEIDKKVGEINGKYSTAGWNPVYYFYRSFDLDSVAAFYNVSDICLVNSLRDGMNLVAKEYVATKRDGKGVLILSEMAGAAIELSDAITINPANIKEIENALVQALETPEEEQKEALDQMQEIISKQDIKQWTHDFIDELLYVKKINEDIRMKSLDKTNFQHIKKNYDAANSRLIVLDYDGTLSKFYTHPMQAYPRQELLELLERMISDPKNNIVINSGRDKQTLEKWLGHLPLKLAAEHGMFYKEKGEWHGEMNRYDWDEELLQIMRNAVKKTPRSKLEIKDTALVWHYRDVDVWLADLRVTQLINELINPSSRYNLQVMKGNKIVEVKQTEFTKGGEVARLLKKKDYDFVLAAGDDTTDEEMFMTLPDEAISIKVGMASQAADYFISAQPAMIDFLERLIQ